MARPPRLLAACAALAAAAAAPSAGGAWLAEELGGAVDRLEARVQEQHARLRALRARREARARRTTDASIFGTGTGTRPYTSQESLTGALDHIWLIACAALVMLMQAGFTMVKAGTCRFRNVQNIMLQNLIDICLGTAGWWALGYSFALSGPFDSDGKKKFGFVGVEQFFGHHLLRARDDGQQEPTRAVVDWFFHLTYCLVATTIVGGGVAERVHFWGYGCFSLLMASVIYPVVVAWTWGSGYLASFNTIGYFDFAGSGVVHLTGGIGALVGAALAGPRVNRYYGQDMGQRIKHIPEAYCPHSLPLVVLGTFVLWFGWYGFNFGATRGMGGIQTGMLAAQVAMNTTLAASTAGIVVFGLRYMLLRKFDVGGFCKGILAGLVSISAGCSNMEVGFAVATAAIGAVLFQVASTSLRILWIDDPVDAFAVHGVCGAWGVIAAALFDWGKGFDHVHAASGFKCILDTATGACKTGVGTDMIVGALAEVGFIILWVGASSLVAFVPMRVAGCFVASPDAQRDGFDILKHSPSKAYEMEDALVRPVA